MSFLLTLRKERWLNMGRYIKSLESGIILGQVIEVLVINRQKEYVVQNKNGRFFLKHNEKVALI